MQHNIRGLVFFACALLPGCGNPFNNQSFSRKAWLKAQHRQRAPMAQDLVRNHIPRGMTGNGIVALLGQPDHIWKKTDGVGYRVKGNRTYAYWLGSWSMQSYDDAFVYVHFDDAGRMQTSEVNGF